MDTELDRDRLRAPALSYGLGVLDDAEVRGPGERWAPDRTDAAALLRPSLRDGPDG